MYVSVEALEPRGTTPTDAPDAPASAAPEEVYVAVFDYQSEEPGDLCFSAGEQGRDSIQSRKLALKLSQ